MSHACARLLLSPVFFDLGREGEHRWAQRHDLQFASAARTLDDLVEPHRIADLHLVLALWAGLHCVHVVVSFRLVVPERAVVSRAVRTVLTTRSAVRS